MNTNPSHKRSRPPMKKRHTKPCKFYQTARCPLSAEECNFAHIYSYQMPILKSPLPCRYFLSGYCANGFQCRYRHALDQSENESGNTSEGRLNPEVDLNVSRYDPHRNNIIRPDYVKNTSSSGGTAHFARMYPWYHGGPYPNSFASVPVYSAPAQIPVPFPASTGHCYHPRRSECASASSPSTCSSPSSLEDPLTSFVTEDPSYSEHSHPFQSRVRVADDRPRVHVPPSCCRQHQLQCSFRHRPPYPLLVDTSYVPPPANMYGTCAFQTCVSPAFLLKKAKAKSRSATRQKIANFKTKPCKFYKGPDTCPNGDDCTFIHEKSPSPTFPHDTTPLLVAQPLPPGLPPKPVSLAEENKKKNFFPISWRVIGGGVLIGGPRLIDLLSGEGDTSQGEEQDEAEANEMPFDPPEPEHLAARGAIHTMKRTRSSSNPPIPTTNHLKIDLKLFPAESPGNL